MKTDHPPAHAWSPLSVDEAFARFSKAPFRWWIAGGHALELHLDRRWREHSDLDIGIRRSDAAAVFHFLDTWQLWIAADGELRRWHGEPLRGEMSENNVWAHGEGVDQWSIDLSVGSGNDSHWIYRRDPSVRRPWDEAILADESGIPYLAPEIQLLFKAKSPRPKDDRDAKTVIPLLVDTERRFLESHLPPAHPWRRLLNEAPESSR